MAASHISDNTHLKICHLNVNSLLAGVRTDRHVPSQCSKLDEIYDSFVIQHEYDVLALTETWLDGSIQDDMIELENYTLYRKDRHRHGGGVMFYINQSIPSFVCTDINFASEILCVDIRLLSKKLLLSVCYRPPGQRAPDIELFLDDLQSLFDYSIDNAYDTLLILGDFNDRCLQWNDDHNLSELRARLRDLTSMNNLYQMITEPTHYTDHSAYLLDLIFTDSPYFVV
jgi:hypothetical protein